MQAASSLSLAATSFSFDLLEARLPAATFPSGDDIHHSAENKSAIQAPRESRPYQNFLIIAPESSGRAFAVSLARYLMGSGFAYVARPEQKQIEDDESGVRYLPLGERLPEFGLMTAVISVGGAKWLAAAALCYPGAQLVEIQFTRAVAGSGPETDAAWTETRVVAETYRLEAEA